jgi:hypothetical protein
MGEARKMRGEDEVSVRFKIYDTDVVPWRQGRVNG